MSKIYVFVQPSHRWIWGRDDVSGKLHLERSFVEETIVFLQGDPSVCGRDRQQGFAKLRQQCDKYLAGDKKIKYTHSQMTKSRFDQNAGLVLLYMFSLHLPWRPLAALLLSVPGGLTASLTLFSNMLSYSPSQPLPSPAFYPCRRRLTG